jgi:type VI secretion system secreted protein VgrG
MDNLMVGIDANVVAGNSISMTAGDSSIKLEKDGTITIKGKKIVVEGDDEVDVNGGVINLN